MKARGAADGERQTIAVLFADITRTTRNAPFRKSLPKCAPREIWLIVLTRFLR
jgi:hypothetical protein